MDKQRGNLIASDAKDFKRWVSKVTKVFDVVPDVASLLVSLTKIKKCPGKKKES
jgi:hypothetical protein